MSASVTALAFMLVRIVSLFGRFDFFFFFFFLPSFSSSFSSGSSFLGGFTGTGRYSEDGSGLSGFSGFGFSGSFWKKSLPSP